MSSYRVLVRFLVCALLVVLSASVAAAQEFGTLSIRARPAGAEILIDGEHWTGSGETGPLQVQLAPGSHRIEVRAPGRQTYVSDVTIRAGETTPLNVSLSMAAPLPEPPPAPAPPRPPSAAGPPQPGSVVEVAGGEDGAVFAPDVRFTEVNHEFATLVGAYAGYVFGGQVMFGGGGYWQVNSTNGLHIAYGGPVVEWRALRGKTIGLNLHALVGGGTGTATSTTAITATTRASTSIRGVATAAALPSSLPATRMDTRITTTMRSSLPIRRRSW